jgi:hypothetical protein
MTAHLRRPTPAGLSSARRRQSPTCGRGAYHSEMCHTASLCSPGKNCQPGRAGRDFSSGVRNFCVIGMRQVPLYRSI